MQTKTIWIVLAGLILVGGGYYYTTQNTSMDDMGVSATPPTEEKKVVTPPIEPALPASAVKEFTMDAFYDDKGVWFSLKEISVKKGDTVRVTVTNTKGMHDFSLDEFGIKKELPLNEPIVVEFTADKVGDFVYYCSKPNHREKGQWGTLRVTE